MLNHERTLLRNDGTIWGWTLVRADLVGRQQELQTGRQADRHTLTQSLTRTLGGVAVRG